jgi:hypothetical protein
LVVSAEVASAALRVESAAVISERSFGASLSLGSIVWQIVASLSSSKHFVKCVRGWFPDSFPDVASRPASGQKLQLNDDWTARRG